MIEVHIDKQCTILLYLIIGLFIQVEDPRERRMLSFEVRPYNDVRAKWAVQATGGLRALWQGLRTARRLSDLYWGRITWRGRELWRFELGVRIRIRFTHNGSACLDEISGGWTYVYPDTWYDYRRAGWSPGAVTRVDAHALAEALCRRDGNIAAIQFIRHGRRRLVEANQLRAPLRP